MNLISLTDYEVLTERHDLEIMRRRHLWPYGSFLGLKHRRAVDPYGVPRKAVLYQFNADSFVSGSPGLVQARAAHYASAQQAAFSARSPGVAFTQVNMG